MGLTPQSIHALGGYRVQGRGDEGRQELIEDALAVQEAGAFMLVLEMVPVHLAAELQQLLHSNHQDVAQGRIVTDRFLVCNDLLGFDSSFQPRFVKGLQNLNNP